MVNGIQITIDKARANMGMVVKSIREDVEGWMGSLIKSLMPSAIG